MFDTSKYKIGLSPKALILFRSISAEFFATYIFIFAITCFYVNLIYIPFLAQSIIVGGLVTLFSAIVVSAAFGAHFNPAITFAAMLLRIVSIPIGIGYILAQLAAAVIASLSVMLVFGRGVAVLRNVVVQKGAGNSYYHSFNAEVIYTFIFVLIVYLVAWCAVEFPYALMIEYPQTEINLSPVLQQNDDNLINDLVLGEEEQTPMEEPDHEYYDDEEVPLSPQAGEMDDPRIRASIPPSLGTAHPDVNEANFLISAVDEQNNSSLTKLAREKKEIFSGDVGRTIPLELESEGPMITATVRSLQIKTAYIPIAIGVTLSFLSMISGTTSGGAFNPARAFGPAVLSGMCIGQWVYWIGDLLGAFLAVVIGYTLFSNKVFIPLSSTSSEVEEIEGDNYDQAELAASPDAGDQTIYVGTPDSEALEMV